LEYCVTVGIEKLDSCGYPIVKKNDFDTKLACDEQTSCDSIVRAMHSIAR